MAMTNKVTRSFYDGDLKNMARQEFRCSGWSTYSESPYAIYKKEMEGADDKQERNYVRPKIL